MQDSIKKKIQKKKKFQFKFSFHLIKHRKHVTSKQGYFNSKLFLTVLIKH